VRPGRQGVKFQELRHAGDRASSPSATNVEGNRRSRRPRHHGDTREPAAFAENHRCRRRRIFLPLTVGGGIRSEEDAAAAVDAGADKVQVSTPPHLKNPALNHDLLRRYGSRPSSSQIDAKRAATALPLRPQRHLGCGARCGRVGAPRPSRPAPAEILFDADGSRRDAFGIRCEMAAAVANACAHPPSLHPGRGRPRTPSATSSPAVTPMPRLRRSIFHYADTASAN